MNSKTAKIVIHGITETGERFRPSDWAERMSGKLCTIHQHRIQYSPLLQPSVKNGYKCVLLDPSLQDSNAALYNSIMEFAKANKLKICEEHHDE